MMKVSEMIEKLKEYNPDAEFCTVVKGFNRPFEICYGNSEGCTKQNCDCVDLFIDTPCEAG